MASENVSKTVSLKDYIIDMQSAAVKGSAQYEVVLENNTDFIIKRRTATTDRELVIFRDSFASSLAPLLLDGYAKITLVDIRYLPSVRLGSFLTFTDQDVLFLYSVNVLNNSETIK